jgi:hypothetical protein
MAVRYDSKSKNNLGVLPLPTGYEGGGKDLPDLYVPPCGIEDVDVAIFNLFDKEISPQCGGLEDAPLLKVPVIFAAGEKWALLKKGRPLRDRNNALLIPLITIVRTELAQDTSSDVTGRGINQQTGEIVIRRKLDKSDRGYQNLINRLFLRNQENLAVDSIVGPSERLKTQGNIGQLSNAVVSGNIGLLSPNLNNNVIETIVVPSPQFYTVKYQVTIWTQYMQHSNQVIEKIFSSFLPQGQAWRLDTSKGYWFVATVEGGNYSSETNFDDMSQAERFIKHTFDISVPAYFFATRAPGAPIPIKRYISSPIIRFEADTSEFLSPSVEKDYVLGVDDPTLPLDQQHNVRPDQRTPGWRSQKVYPIDGQDTNDPAIDVKLNSRRHITEMMRGPNGETVFTGASLGGLEIIIGED